MLRYGSLLLSVVVIAGCGSRAETREPDPTRGQPRFDAVVEIDPATARMDAEWRLAFLPDDDTRDSLVLYLNGGLHVDSVTGARVAGFTQDAEGDVVVRFSSALDLVTRLTLFASGVPTFGDDGINRIASDWIELGLDSEWQPVLGGYGEEMAGRLELRVPDGWQVVSSGSASVRDDAIVVRQDVPLIDVPFAAAPRIDSIAGTTATLFFTPGRHPDDIAPLLRAADACAGYLDARYGAADPLPRAKVLLAPRTGPGYARKNYVVVTDVQGMTGAGLTNFLCHELAHFWSTGAQPMSPDNWLNEAFAEFVAGRAVREINGQTAYDELIARWAEGASGTPPIWTPTTTSRPGPRVSYRKAPHLLHRFEERIGSQMMDALLREYMTRRIPTTNELLAIVQEVAGAEQAEWFRAELAR